METHEIEEKRLVSRRTLDALFIFQIIVNIVVLALIIGLLFTATSDIADVSEAQTRVVQQQNNVQLCTQFEMLRAIRKIGIKLGLPVDDIVLPDVRGLECDAQLAPALFETP